MELNFCLRRNFLIFNFGIDRDAFVGKELWILIISVLWDVVEILEIESF